MDRQITYFNRHESMNSLTRERIMDLISDLQCIQNCPSHGILNMLYGAFDGYDYSEIIKVDPAIKSLNDGGNTYLVKEILDIVSIIEKYPRTQNPNNNNF
jgi:hypothetical protein